jgi:CDP-diacylglycerol---serine O-phosphatidyltransferase
VASLMISRLPVYSGKAAGTKLRSDWVMPTFLFIVGYVAFLMSYTWQTLTLTTIAFFITLPFSARAWKRFEAADAAALANADKDGSEAIS